METNTKLAIQRLKVEHVLKPFDCGNDDLNEFFLKDAILYQEHRLAVTYFGEMKPKHFSFFL